MENTQITNLHQHAYDALMMRDPNEKIAAVQALYQQQRQSPLPRISHLPEVKRIETPGRPQKPELVAPAKVKQRKLTTEEGRATLVHAITHIEFNAINLALDAVYRFRDMPEQFYTDWLKVASEEAKHFSLLTNRLSKFHYEYGDFPAHNGLWEMTVKTDHDVLTRMALVPRVLEARGLDVTPGMIEKLKQVGDQETIDVLDIILEEEIGHVAIGSRWFQYCCENQSLEPKKTFQTLISQYMKGKLRGPFNKPARALAGFSEQELQELEQLSSSF